MAKYLRKKKKKPVALIVTLVVILLILLIAFGLFLLPQLLYELSGAQEETIPEQTTVQEVTTGNAVAEVTEAVVPTLKFPMQVEDGRLEINSLFQVSGINPDCDNQEGTDIAGVQLQNVSGSHLTRATVEMTLSSGKLLHFTVEDLPADMTALVFSDENVSIDSDDACVSLSCEASFEAESPLMEDRLSVSVEDTQITVTNISGDDLSDLTVYCHCLLDQDSYGGLTYCYPIEFLPAGGSATVDAADCYLGGAEVVRIGMADQ